MIKAIALDPGGTSGYCEATIRFDLVKLSYDQAEWSELELWAYLDEQMPDEIVYESFQYRAGGKMRQTGILRPCELIGVIKLYGQGFARRGNSLHPQVSSKAVGNNVYFTDQRLKNMGLYIPGKEHGRVACKHMLYWLQFGSGMQYADKQYEFELV